MDYLHIQKTNKECLTIFYYILSFSFILSLHKEYIYHHNLRHRCLDLKDHFKSMSFFIFSNFINNTYYSSPNLPVLCYLSRRTFKLFKGFTRLDGILMPLFNVQDFHVLQWFVTGSDEILMVDVLISLFNMYILVHHNHERCSDLKSHCNSKWFLISATLQIPPYQSSLRSRVLC